MAELLSQSFPAIRQRGPWGLWLRSKRLLLFSNDQLWIRKTSDGPSCLFDADPAAFALTEPLSAQTAVISQPEARCWSNAARRSILAARSPRKIATLFCLMSLR